MRMAGLTEDVGLVSPEKIVGIRPCDGITRGNNYCCDDGSKGRGSFHCCKTSSALFTVGTDVPSILAEMPIAWTSTASSAGTTATSATTGASQSATDGAGSNDGGDNGGSNSQLGVGLGAGLGVGLPAVAVIIGGLVFLSRRRKKKALGDPVPTSEPAPEVPKYGAFPGRSVPEMGPGASPAPPTELPGGERRQYELP